uniref:Uncharacterized protein n=1 Tax=Stegastes partitus TaxID=144197 RepID=A0A3B4ZHC0_9TELE
MYFCKLDSVQESLGCQFLGLCLLQLSDAGCRFRAHDTTSPLTNIHLLVSVVVVGLDGFHKLDKTAKHFKKAFMRAPSALPLASVRQIR